LLNINQMTYQQIIIAATGCAPADAPEIERIMRERFVFGSELDDKSAKRLVWGARRAKELLDCTRTPEGIAYSEQVENEILAGLNPR